MTAVIAAAAGGAALGGLVAWLRGRRRRRRLESELEDARRRLAAASEARETFFGLATHELRSPLSAIFGYQELLRDGAYGEVSDEAADALDRMGRAAHHLLHLIDGIIELGRIRSGEVRLDADTVDIGIVLSTTAEAFRTQARDRGITPTVELSPTTARIRTDRERLLRAIDLAVTSAIRHPAEHSMTLRAAVDGGAVTLRVGPVDLEVGSDLHDPASTGIRLRAAGRIVELLGGTLDLRVDDGHIREITLRVPTLEPADGL